VIAMGMDGSQPSQLFGATSIDGQARVGIDGVRNIYHGQCLACNLRDIVVPQQLSWGGLGFRDFNPPPIRARTCNKGSCRLVEHRSPVVRQIVKVTDELTGFWGANESYEGYWDMLEIFTPNGLHTTCELPRNSRLTLLNSLLLRMQRGGHASLHISFVGDSFMRETWLQLFQLVARKPAVRDLAKFSKLTYHQDHLFCCSTYETVQLVALNETGAALRALGNNCTVEYAYANRTQFEPSLAGVLASWHRTGAVCASWILRPT